MARKTQMYRVEDKGRDYNKAFLITEMSASQAESWAMRVLLALMANNVELPEGFETLGMAGLAELGLRSLSGLKWETAEPLLAEMFACVKVIPDPKRPEVSRDLLEDDIDEVSTRLKLRVEIFKLHTDFLEAVAPSIFPAGARAAEAPRRATKTSRRS